VKALQRLPSPVNQNATVVPPCVREIVNVVGAQVMDVRVKDDQEWMVPVPDLVVLVDRVDLLSSECSTRMETDASAKKRLCASPNSLTNSIPTTMVNSTLANSWASAVAPAEIVNKWGALPVIVPLEIDQKVPAQWEIAQMG